MRPGLQVSVVVPALNEERNLPHVLSRIPTDVAEVILVDGGSVDGTVAKARQVLPSVIVVQQTRTGKGNALACGFAVSTGDIVVMIDADGSTDPAEIPRFVDALLDGADYAKGSRFRPGGGSHDITRLRKLGNHVLNGTVNALFRTHFTDLCYGYNAFWREALKVMDLPDLDLPRPPGGERLWGDGFEIETLINVRVASHGLKITEVASIEKARLHGVSNLNAFGDGWRVLRTIFAEYQRHRELAKRERAIELADEPAAAQSPAAQSPAAQSPAAQSPGTESAATEPAATESAATESAATESAATESAATGSPVDERAPAADQAWAEQDVAPTARPSIPRQRTPERAPDWAGQRAPAPPVAVDGEW
jgi:pyruvate/2-oxoglutarate dehydrogenase complex dihydrolipoamide acyltransferase (E2) component